jgi:hypothetical protein
VLTVLTATSLFTRYTESRKNVVSRHVEFAEGRSLK